MAPFAYLLSIYIVIARSNRKCELYMLASIRYTVYHKSTGYVQSPELQSFRGVVHLFADGSKGIGRQGSHSSTTLGGPLVVYSSRHHAWGAGIPIYRGTRACPLSCKKVNIQKWERQDTPASPEIINSLRNLRYRFHPTLLLILTLHMGGTHFGSEGLGCPHLL